MKRAPVALALLLPLAPVHAATITVTTTESSSDSACSLNDALSSANGNFASGACVAGQALPTVDTIAFAIPPFDGGVRTIPVFTLLPNVNEAVVIDGLTQPGATCNGGFPSLKIFLDGVGSANGLVLRGPGSLVRGLVLDNFANNQITIPGGAGAQGNANVIQCNVIGMDPTGTSAGQEFPEITYGLDLSGGNDNIIGTDGDGVNDANEGNYVAGNEVNVSLMGGLRNRISGNHIGIGASGTAPPTSATTRYGVLIAGGVLATVVGSDADGVSDALEGNVVAFNGQASGGGGVVVWSDSRENAVRGNAIFGNRPLGIDLSFAGSEGTSEPNDPLDADTGANEWQNRPVLSTADRVGAELRVIGTLPSAASQDFEVELFGSASCSPTGFGQGEVPLGTTVVTTNAVGDASFDVLVVPTPSTRFITALATDVMGNTSEFSACIRAGLLIDGFEDSSGSARQRRDFLGRQRSPFALGEVAELQRADRDAHEPQHADLEGLEQAADLAVAAFVEHDLEPRVLLARAQHGYGLRAQRDAVDDRAGVERLQ
jgi:hypothetical protein